MIERPASASTRVMQHCCAAQCMEGRMPFPMAMLPRTLRPCASYASLRRALAYYGNLQTVSL